jgi:hypothetical protein
MSGIGISPDSVNYESAASNIRNHFSFTDFNGRPLVDFPLGYPSFLAFISWITGVSVLHVAPVVNCFLISGVIFLTSIIIDSFQHKSKIYKIAILSLIACSPVCWRSIRNVVVGNFVSFFNAVVYCIAEKLFQFLSNNFHYFSQHLLLHCICYTLCRHYIIGNRFVS